MTNAQTRVYLAWTYSSQSLYTYFAWASVIRLAIFSLIGPILMRWKLAFMIGWLNCSTGWLRVDTMPATSHCLVTRRCWSKLFLPCIAMWMRMLVKLPFTDLRCFPQILHRWTSGSFVAEKRFHVGSGGRVRDKKRGCLIYLEQYFT